MKTIYIKAKTQGMIINNLEWEQLLKIDQGKFDEDSEKFILFLTNGNVLTIYKSDLQNDNEIKKEYLGSLEPIEDSSFIFSAFKDNDSVFEIRHFYYPPEVGGYAILLITEN